MVFYPPLEPGVRPSAELRVATMDWSRFLWLKVQSLNLETRSSFCDLDFVILWVLRLVQSRRLDHLRDYINHQPGMQVCLTGYRGHLKYKVYKNYVRMIAGTFHVLSQSGSYFPVAWRVDSLCESPTTSGVMNGGTCDDMGSNTLLQLHNPIHRGQQLTALGITTLTCT
nr:hypothetical protein CFP56_11291 [Quercus suber]